MEQVSEASQAPKNMKSEVRHHLVLSWGNNNTLSMEMLPHPPYSDMISTFISHRRNRNGVTRTKMARYVSQKYGIQESKAVAEVRIVVMRGLEDGTLKRAKESGKGSQKFKLSQPPPKD